MINLTNRVFEIFNEIAKIPHGSGNMSKIADYCVAFAEKNKLRFIRDKADNIVIFKEGSGELKNTAPIILQGHLDMVCQKTAESCHNFDDSGLEVFIDGDFLKAKDTTLGADNGIAVAMVMAILESNELSHPPIEAVFTVDEEIGMLGAMALDCSILKGQRLINLDSEEDDTVTVSCAGGSEFEITIPINRTAKKGTRVALTVSGLKGGHSGVEIDKGRVNANILAGRILNHLFAKNDFEIISINGGDKSNAITPLCNIEVCTSDADSFIELAKQYTDLLKKEFSAREPDFELSISKKCDDESKTIGKELTEKIISFLVAAPNGVINMSAEIDGLVETSLNLGILKTEEEKIVADFSLRSNKISALTFLEEKLAAYVKPLNPQIKTFGHYPPWEFKPDSRLQEIYIENFTEHYGKEPKVSAIHAGLECGVFASKLDNLDCIAVGPNMFDVHTVKEKLSISSTKKFFELLLKVLSDLR